MYLKMGIIKLCTHSHSPPSTPTTATHPKYLPTHPHSPKIVTHPPPPTQDNAPLFSTQLYLHKICPIHTHSSPPTQNNVSSTQNNPQSLKIMPH